MKTTKTKTVKQISARLSPYGLYVTRDLKVRERRGPYGFDKAVMKRLRVVSRGKPKRT